MKRYFWAGATAAFIMIGCASTSSLKIQRANSDFATSKSPLRYVRDLNYKHGERYVVEFAGVKGTSATAHAKQVRSDVFKTIQQHCGFREKDLAETRIVEHKPPYFYEVWVFKDPKSKRDDKRSALSVVLHQLPSNQGVDFTIRGQCHAQKGMVLTFAK